MQMSLGMRGVTGCVQAAAPQRTSAQMTEAVNSSALTVIHGMLPDIVIGCAFTAFHEVPRGQVQLCLSLSLVSAPCTNCSQLGRGCMYVV
jgi:hypothetical protein